MVQVLVVVEDLFACRFVVWSVIMQLHRLMMLNMGIIVECGPVMCCVC